MKLKEYSKIGERVYFRRLENGLGLFCVQKPDYYKSFAFFAANYGGADRRFRLDGEWIDTPAGVAHYLEHKMFDMPDGNALTQFTMNGANPNAFTSSDMTAYHFECTDRFYDNLELLLRFVSTPYFTEDSVEKERGIIGQEIRMTEDNPYHAIYYGLLRSLYKYNPIKDPVAGTVESIAEITPDVLNACHRVFYNPSNMVLCVCGDQDPEKIADTAREILPRFRGPVPEKDYGKKESLNPVKAMTERIMEVGIPTFLMGAKDGAAASGDGLLRRELVGELALELIAGRSSALYARLYNDGIINGSFSADFETSAGQSYVIMGGESGEPDRAFNEISSAAAIIGEKGPDKQMFERQKKAAIGRKLRELDSFDDICYSVAKGYFGGYDPFGAIDVLSGITEDDVKSFARDVLSDERLALAIIRG